MDVKLLVEYIGRVRTLKNVSFLSFVMYYIYGVLRSSRLYDTTYLETKVSLLYCRNNWVLISFTLNDLKLYNYYNEGKPLFSNTCGYVLIITLSIFSGNTCVA